VTESTAPAPPVIASPDVTEALAARDYARVARIAYADPGQLTARAADEYTGYGYLYRWRTRAEATADTLIAAHIAAHEETARRRGEFDAWTLMVDMLARFEEVAAVGGRGAPAAVRDAECIAIVGKWARHELGKARAALTTAVEAIP